MFNKLVICFHENNKPIIKIDIYTLKAWLVYLLHIYILFTLVIYVQCFYRVVYCQTVSRVLSRDFIRVSCVNSPFTQITIVRELHDCAFSPLQIKEEQLLLETENESWTLHLKKMTVENLLPANFGYAIFTYLYSFVMLMYLGLQVGSARKKYGVKVR